MEIQSANRQSMVIAGLLQGAAMLALHEWFKAHGFKPADLAWAAPLYSLAVFGPVTFNFLRGEFSSRQSLKGAVLAALLIAGTAAWLGWSLSSAPEADALRGHWASGLFVFGLSSLVAWFVGLPFLQGKLRTAGLRFPYPRLFADAWRNALLVANCLVFTGFFWLLLGLWAGLFSVLKIGFFLDLFSSRFFIYLATAMSIGFAVSLEEHEASALITLRRHLLAFQTRLLPLAALIVLLFLAALPFSGVEPLWKTGHATSLMLCLQLAIIALTNAAWQDGERPAPFSRHVLWPVRASLALLPVLSALCVWSLSLRIGQYGWTVDRFWAAILVGITGLYALGYAMSAVRSGWLSSLGAFNTWIALALVAILLAIHTPLLDPQRISAASQVARLLSGKSDAERFDYNYLRFNLGKAGDAALKELTALADHPQAETIRGKATEALARKERHGANQPPLPSKDEISGKLKAYPAGTRVDPAFVDYLDARLAKNKYDYTISALKGSAPVPLLAIDLGDGEAPEYILLAQPYPVFSLENKKWRQAGQIDFNPDNLKDADIEALLKNGDFSPQSRQWRDLKIGDRFGQFMFRQQKSPE